MYSIDCLKFLEWNRLIKINMGFCFETIMWHNEIWYLKCELRSILCFEANIAVDFNQNSIYCRKNEKQKEIHVDWYRVFFLFSNFICSFLGSIINLDWTGKLGRLKGIFAEIIQWNEQTDQLNWHDISWRTPLICMIMNERVCRYSSSFSLSRKLLELAI